MAEAPQMAKTAPQLFVIGNPLLDILANVDDAFLSEFDLKANNAILAEQQHEEIFTRLGRSDEVEYMAGGAAQNTARGARWMCPQLRVVYTGAVGCDEFAETLRKAADKDGVNTLYCDVEHVKTGTCAVLVTQSGECRSLVTRLGAAQCYRESYLDQPSVWQEAVASRAVYVGGYFLSTCVPAAVKLAHLANKSTEGCLFAMNLSATFICGPGFRDALDVLLPACDIVFCNSEEALALAEDREWAIDVEKAAAKIAEIEVRGSTRARKVVVTQGSDDVIVASVNSSSSSSSPPCARIEKFEVPVLAKEAVVDTNGAGDAFAGAFMAQAVLGRPLRECVNAGIYLARLVIQQSGASYPDLAIRPTEFSRVPV